MADLKITIGKTEIEFHSYSFTPATVYPTGLVPYDAINEVIKNSAPPEIRTIDEEVLFIPARQRGELFEFADRNGIAVVARVDVWSLILEPFLDTEVSQESQEKTIRVLQENGVSRKECEGLRGRFARTMKAYNIDSMLWDGSDLGLCDLLSALSGELSGDAYRIPDDEMDAVYWKVMEIAHRGKKLTA